MNLNENTYPQFYYHRFPSINFFPTIKMIPDTGFIYVRLISIIFALAGWENKKINADYLFEG